MKSSTLQFWICVFLVTVLNFVLAMIINTYSVEDGVDHISIELDEAKVSQLKAAADEIGVKSFETSKDTNSFPESFNGFKFLFFINSFLIAAYIVINNFFDKRKDRRIEEA